eukprot:7272030-Pyramimonas_sp.AAC.1
MRRLGPVAVVCALATLSTGRTPEYHKQRQHDAESCGDDACSMLPCGGAKTKHALQESIGRLCQPTSLGWVSGALCAPSPLLAQKDP